MSWQLPPKPPEPEQRRGRSGFDPDNIDPCWTACCILDTLSRACCWWPLAAQVAAALVLAAASSAC